MFRILSYVMLGALLTGTLPGCSVFMAASGDDDPQMHMVQRGAPRYVVEGELGPAVSETTDEDGNTVCTYKVEVGNESSGARAGMHAVLDILTIGIWEVVGTPIEATQGDIVEATVTYGSDNTVTDLQIVEPPKETQTVGGKTVPDYPE